MTADFLWQIGNDPGVRESSGVQEEKTTQPLYFPFLWRVL
jgi:hypothetical protein